MSKFLAFEAWVGFRDVPKWMPIPSPRGFDWGGGGCLTARLTKHPD